jgi:hypothetical protein
MHDAGNSVEPLNGVSKGGEHPLCDILIGAGVNTPAAKWLRLFVQFLDEAGFFQLGDEGVVDELFRFRRLGRRIDGKFEHGLHARR